MKKLKLFLSLFLVSQQVLIAQMGTPQIGGKEVYKGEDVVFHEIDQHTWVGTGPMMANESLYLVAGNDMAVLLNEGYGFCGDSFGSGNLLLTTNFSTLLATCKKTSALMEKHQIDHFYPGHYFGTNVETLQRIDDMITLSKDILSGKEKGEENSRAMLGLDLVINKYGVRINYNEKALQ